jgi:hypothetical protein
MVSFGKPIVGFLSLENTPEYKRTIEYPIGNESITEPG